MDSTLEENIRTYDSTMEEKENEKKELKVNNNFFNLLINYINKLIFVINFIK